MNENLKRPEIGTTCPALTDEYYEYKLSGDAANHCKCILNNERCIGIVQYDDEDQSSRFFSRARNFVDLKEIKKCPMYGMSKEFFISLIEDKAKQELDDKFKSITNFKK